MGRLSREELDERVTAAYSARTCGELRDLSADLPLPSARTGLPSDIVASRRVSRRASRFVGQLIWIFFVLVLAAGLVGLASPAAAWLAAMPIPIALLLLTSESGISRQRITRAGTRSGRRDPKRGG